MKNRTLVDDNRKKRWLWFIGIYLASLATFAAIVYLLRWLIVK